jgi:LacI family transcriptional regulator
LNESRLSLEDIAKKAGVSRSTVSRVINKEPYVSEKTRVRVMEIIEQESFRPNPAARMLVTQRTHIIGMVIPQITNVFFTDNSYFPMLLQGASSAISSHDHAMLLWLQQNNETRERFAQRIAENRLMDGIVLSSIVSGDPIVKAVMDIGLPFMAVERPIGFASEYADDFNYVSVDNIHAAMMAVEHLIRLGRRRIAHITGHMTIADGQDRLQGYRQALQKADMPVDENLIYPGFFNREYGYLGMKALLKHKPDALFAAGDTTAQGALQAIHEAGLRVPEDIAVVGFDDLDIATQTTPKLTTIRQPVQQKGMTAASLLIDRIEERANGPQRVLLPTELVIRQSCGAIPS